MCLICAEGFSNAEMLKTHCKTHDTESVEKPKYAVWYACELCKKKFIRDEIIDFTPLYMIKYNFFEIFRIYAVKFHESLNNFDNFPKLLFFFYIEN